MSSGLAVIGLNHKTAPVEVREKVTFSANRDGALTRAILALTGVREAIILSTCNRSEVIAQCDPVEEVVHHILKAVADLNGVDQHSLAKHSYVKIGADAVRHVFRVAASLDSMILGEPQILGQVKESFKRDSDADTIGPTLSRLMHRAFFTAKKVRNETGIGLAAVSVAYAAVELAKKILGELNEKSVLLIGAGEMAELTARHLIGQVMRPICVANRTFENACKLADEFGGEALRVEQLSEALAQADIIISSTGACEPVIKAADVKNVMKTRKYRPMFLIDIAVPRDIEPSANDLDGVYLYNIDDLQAVVSENLGERMNEALKAQEIVDEEVTKFMNWTKTLDLSPTIVALREKLEGIRSGEIARMNGKLSKLEDGQRKILEIITKSIINKIAHDPISFLKKTKSTIRRDVNADIVQRVFNLHGFSISRDGSEENLENEADNRN